MSVAPSLGMIARTFRCLGLAVLLPGLGGCALLTGMTSSAAPANGESSSAPTAPKQNTALTSAPTPEPTTEAAAPEPPRPVSVTLRNTCSETVKIFFGDKPKFGSGTYSSLSSNSSTSHSFMPGDMFWIVDESQNGVSSVTIADNTRTVEVGSGCASLNAR